MLPTLPQCSIHPKEFMEMRVKTSGEAGYLKLFDELSSPLFELIPLAVTLNQLMIIHGQFMDICGDIPHIQTIKKDLFLDLSDFCPKSTQ